MLCSDLWWTVRQYLGPGHLQAVTDKERSLLIWRLDYDISAWQSQPGGVRLWQDRIDTELREFSSYSRGLWWFRRDWWEDGYVAASLAQAVAYYQRCSS